MGFLDDEYNRILKEEESNLIVEEENTPISTPIVEKSSGSFLDEEYKP